jgi:hypothetical protein
VILAHFFALIFHATFSNARRSPPRTATARGYDSCPYRQIGAGFARHARQERSLSPSPAPTSLTPGPPAEARRSRPLHPRTIERGHR